MRTTLCVLLLAAVAGCTGLGGLDLNNLAGGLGGLGGTICAFYDTNGDGVVGLDEARDVMSSVYGADLVNAFSDADLRAAFEQVYGCTVE